MVYCVVLQNQNKKTKLMKYSLLVNIPQMTIMTKNMTATEREYPNIGAFNHLNGELFQQSNSDIIPITYYIVLP